MSTARLAAIASVIGIAAALATGYAAGRASSAVPAAMPVAALECSARPTQAVLDADQLATSVRSAVRAELASRCSSSPAASSPSSEVVPGAPGIAQRDAAADQMDRMLDDALRRGRWEPEDQVRLRETLGTLRDPRRETAILQRLSAAINAGELEIGFEGPMF